MVSTHGVKGQSSDHATGLKRDAKVENESGKTESLTAEGKKGASKKPGPSSKVAISEQGRKLAKKDSTGSADGAEVDPAMMEEKKNDLVDFYAKQLKKATEKLEKDVPSQVDETSSTSGPEPAKMSESV